MMRKHQRSREALSVREGRGCCASGANAVTAIINKMSECTVSRTS